MNRSNNDMVNALFSEWVEHARQKAVEFAPLGLVPLFCDCEKFYLLKMTAVLTSRKDGKQALGKIEGGKVVPTKYLKDSNKHPEPGSNYIVDWLKLANIQLLRSGACFGFDIGGLQYVLEADDDLNRRDCGDGKFKETNAFIQKKIDEGDSAYKDRVLLIFRWGQYADRSGGGCSSSTAMNILMPGYYEEWVWLDGKMKYGNNLLTHEFGHYMGLQHTFPALANEKLGKLINQNDDNKYLYPLHKKYLPFLPALTESDLSARRDIALDMIKTWGAAIDPDTGGDDKANIPVAYGIKDTVVDLGVALPLLMGDSACGGDKSYAFDRYDPQDLEKVPWAENEWKPKPNTKPSYAMTVVVNKKQRNNLMSYWRCDREGQLFSKHQVKRMLYVLLHNRQAIIGKAIKWTAPCWVLEFPWWVENNVPLERPARLIVALWSFALRLVAPKAWEGWRFFADSMVFSMQHWDEKVYRRYLEEKERSGELEEMIERSFKPQFCGVEDIVEPEGPRQVETGQ